MPKSTSDRSKDSDRKMLALRAALEEGERSGSPSEFDFEAFIKSKRKPAN